MRRVVLDTGVLIAALLSPSGSPARLLVAWIQGHYELVVSEQLLEELARVLARPKFRRYLPIEEAAEYVRLLRHTATLLNAPPAQAGLTPDPGDDYLVALARAADARFLISGDTHLTGMADPDPPVLTPRQFLALLEG